MIKRIYVENYKCLVDFDLLLQDTTLLLGAIGAGKTAVLEPGLYLRTSAYREHEESRG